MEIFDLNKLFLINETLIDKLFDIFDEDFQIKNDKGFSDELENQLKQICKNEGEGVDIEFKYVDGAKVGGHYYAKQKLIVIDIPKQKERVLTNKILEVVFHEYAHHLLELAKPKEFNPTEDNKDIVNYKEQVSEALKITLDKMIKNIDYFTQPAEKSNVAFTIAYGLYVNNSFKASLIKDLAHAHAYEWEKYISISNNNHVELINYMQQLGQMVGSQLYFRLIVYAIELSKYKTNKDAQKASKKLPVLFTLVDKYYKRLAGILRDDKSYVKNIRNNKSEAYKEVVEKVLPTRYRTR